MSEILILVMGGRGGRGSIGHILNSIRLEQQFKESQEKMEVIFSDDIQTEKDIKIWVDEAKELFINAENVLSDKLEDVVEISEKCFDLRTEYFDKDITVYNFKRHDRILTTQYIKPVRVCVRNRL